MCDDGTKLEVQVKRGLQRGTELWEAIKRICLGLKADPELFGVLMVDSTASGSIKTHLREDIRRLAHGRTGGLKDITEELALRE